MKKAISILLALVLILSAAPAVFAADEAPDTSKWTMVWDAEDGSADLTAWTTDAVGGGEKAPSVASTWLFKTAEGKGVKGSKALEVWMDNDKTTSMDAAWCRMTYFNFNNSEKAVTDWTGATELMYYVDASAVNGGKSANIRMYFEHDGTVNWTQPQVKKACKWYLWENGQWTEKATSDWGHIQLPDGYKGYVRVELSAFYKQVDYANVTKLCFDLENKDGNASMYFDNFMINVAPAGSDEPSKTGDGAMLVAAMIVAAASATGVALILKKKEF